VARGNLVLCCTNPRGPFERAAGIRKAFESNQGFGETLQRVGYARVRRSELLDTNRQGSFEFRECERELAASQVNGPAYGE
jgi:hypothetical protein